MAMKSVNGELVPLSAAEQAEFDARQQAGVDVHRENRRRKFQADAASRILALYPGVAPDELQARQMEDLARAAELLRKETKGTATQAESAELDALEQKKAGIDAIISARDSAYAQLDAAGTDTTLTVDQRIAEIDAVTPVWP